MRRVRVRVRALGYLRGVCLSVGVRRACVLTPQVTSVPLKAAVTGLRGPPSVLSSLSFRFIV